MSRLIVASILFACIALTSAAVYRGTYKDADYPGKCVIKDLNLILSPGDEVPHPNKCVRIICHKDSLVIQYSCGVIGAGDGCIVGAPTNASAIYPNCCSREIICNNIDK